MANPGKLITFEALSGFRAPGATDPDEVIILDLGTYDVLHDGHDQGLDFASSLGMLVVGVWPDLAVEEWKGEGRPINTAQRRMRMLSSMEQVAYVFEVPYALLGSPASRRLGATAILHQLEPDVLVLGGEKSVPPGTFQTATDREVQVIFDLGYLTKRTSTTEVVAKMNGHRADFGFAQPVPPLRDAAPLGTLDIS